MILLQVVPDTIYFIWQLYVQMQNFRDLGLEKDAVILVATEKPSAAIKKFESWTEATIYYYPDTRESKFYLSSIRPHIISKYLRDHPQGCFLYLDQDVIFLKRPDLKLLEETQYCYVAEGAKSYTDVSYLKGFKQYIFPSMAEIVGISTTIIEMNDQYSGGAQYVIKCTNYEWWEKVERDCESLYYYMVDISRRGLRKYKPDEFLPEDGPGQIQKWCADMWAVLWNLWGSGKEVRHHEYINFSWPYESVASSKYMMHNAGICSDTPTSYGYDKWPDGKPRYFNKSWYTNISPLGQNFNFVSRDVVQSVYIDTMNKVFSTMKNDSVTISVLTLTYRRLKLLQEAAMSVMVQSSPVFEMVIINDDSEVDYISEHSFIKVVNCNSRFSSVGSKLKFGLSQCKGDYILRLDDDDLLVPDSIERILEEIKNNPGYDIYSSSGFYYFNDNSFNSIGDAVNNGNVYSKQYAASVDVEDKNFGEDVSITFNGRRFKATGKPWMIYRWGMNTIHLSALGDISNDQSYNKVDENTEALTGNLYIQPKFELDYYNQIPQQ